MIPKFRYHSENSVIAKIEIFAMHSHFCYDSENSSVPKFWHCSALFHCSLLLLFPLHYSISSFFDILHSRLAEIDSKPYEILQVAKSSCQSYKISTGSFSSVFLLQNSFYLIMHFRIWLGFIVFEWN